MTGGRALAVAVALAAVLSACGGISQGELNTEIQERGGGLGSTLALDTLAVLEEELGDELVLRSFTMTPSQATVEVLVPDSVNEVDGYRYGTSGLYGTGDLDGPDPVAGVGPPETLRPTLFRAGRVAFEDLDAIVDEAIATAGLEGGYAQSMRVDRSTPRPRITVTVSSPRETVAVQFRADGSAIGGGDR